eukprot:GHVU01222891.1.p1 GENE.GHVU01222891.1~~GHVU01222891.1.p1  ORF type:complete len:207 (-),score=20.95 GHVU01222891.1:252-872(-)
MKPPPTAEQRLVRIEEAIIREVTRPLIIRPEYVYTARSRESIRHLLWLGPAHYDTDASHAGVQPWLDRLHARAVALARERRRRADRQLLCIREAIYAESDTSEAVFSTRHRGAARNWILRGIGDGDEELTDELLESLLDGVYAQIAEEENEARAEQQQEHYARIHAEWRAARARGDYFTPTASTAASDQDEALIDGAAGRSATDAS